MIKVTRKMLAPLALALSVGATVGAAVLPAGAATAPKLKTVSGKILTVNATPNTLTLKVGKKTDTITTTATTTVKIASKTSTLSVLKVGENATVKYHVVAGTWVASSIAVKLGSTK